MYLGGIYGDGRETTELEFKELCIKNPNPRFNDTELKQIIETGYWDDKVTLAVNSSLKFYMDYILPKYISSFVNSNINGKLLIGIDDCGEITGVPYRGELSHNYILGLIAESISNNIKPCNNIKDILENHFGEKCYFFDGFGKTTTFFDYIFEVNDSYISYCNSNTLTPIHFIRDVNEGGYKIKQDYRFNYKEREVLVEDSLYQIPEYSQDMISAFYYARTLLSRQKIKQDSILKINIFMDEENYPMRIRYLKNEIVKTKWGKINCMVFAPQLQIGRIFQKEEEMRIWISDDDNKLMIKVETKIIIGVIKAELSSFEGLKNPLSITD